MPQAFPQSYTNQAVGQPGLPTDPGKAAQDNPKAKGFLPNNGGVFPNGDVEVPGHEGSDVSFDAGQVLNVAEAELSPADYAGGDGISGDLSKAPSGGI